MENRLFAQKATISTAVSAFGAALGWKGILLIVWVVAMALDYLSGSMAASKRGQWSSKTARQGLWHKGGMILVVLVAGLADLGVALACEYLQFGIQWPGAVLPLVLAWYIITELGSILENAVLLGANVPTWLTKLLKISMKKVEAVGGSLTDEEDAQNE